MDINNTVQFDSNEERNFDWWLQELKELGYIKEIIHQPKAYSLSDQLTQTYYEPYKKKIGGKYISEELLAGHIYTPDVKVIWEHRAFTSENPIAIAIEGPHIRKKKNRSFIGIIAQRDVEKDHYYSIIEVKPSFDQNNMTRIAKINIKWVWDKYGVFVNIIIPEKHFDKTFTPKRFLTTDKSGKPRKIKYKNIKSLKQFIEK